VDESHCDFCRRYGGCTVVIGREKHSCGARVPAPSALDNRPLRFDEFEEMAPQVVCISATPGDHELLRSGGVVVEQVVRPTGLLDPPVEVRPVKGQIDNLLAEIRRHIDMGHKALVMTLTKRMSEDLHDFFRKSGIRSRYLHSEIKSLERMQILRELRTGGD